MKEYLKVHPWKIIEDTFHPEFNKISESIFSLGNGKMGQRGNFEEYFSGHTLQGNYVGGIYYPDKTRVGWWKIGYPEYYAKVLNAANWNLLDIYVNGERLDLAKVTILDFYRELDLKEGILRRSAKIQMSDDTVVLIKSKRINALGEKELGLIHYEIQVIKGEAHIEVKSIIDFDVRNEDANYNENFWHEYTTEVNADQCYISAVTKKTCFSVGVAQEVMAIKNNTQPLLPKASINNKNAVGRSYEANLTAGEVITIEKYAAILSTFNHKEELIQGNATFLAAHSKSKGFGYFEDIQRKLWAEKWADIDIEIQGDEEAQQGIRFNIFQLHQTYSGDDNRLNIGPKGFTGERYGGSTYWDTEAYCIPFYLSTAEESVAEALLIYRYKHLEKAIENAQKLGFSGGAALYPMVTMNGEESHNEWEITFEEIHRNGAIAFAIFNYIRYTGKKEYLAQYGLEVLIAISRFWAQRVHYSEKRKKYVMLGVTGPNEYENNVNNNWYTNYIATWTFRYTLDSITYVQDTDSEVFKDIILKTKFSADVEIPFWKSIIEEMYYPEHQELGIFLQQDNYMDKEQILVKDLDPKHLPLNQNWSWDRILRSCFIKQADVLQGLFFFEDEFDEETIERNFLFYEPRTVHESSLSPCVHSILASKLQLREKAYEMYVRTARLDLNDYNNDTEDGLHITSMAGTWMSVVKGFGGMRIKDGALTLNPMLPVSWDSYHFKIKFRGSVLKINVTKTETTIENLSTTPAHVQIYDKQRIVKGKNHFALDTHNI